MSDDDGPTWDEIEAKYRLPGGGWNWPAMPIDVYRRVDSVDFSNGIVSIGSGAPTEYTSYSVRQRVQMDRDEHNRENEQNPLTAKGFTKIVGISAGMLPGWRWQRRAFEPTIEQIKTGIKLRARKK